MSKIKIIIHSNFTILYLFLLIIIFFCDACKKKQDPPSINIPSQTELPPATQEGKQILGFLLDGELWLPEVHCFPCYKFNVSYGYATGDFSLSAHRTITEKKIFQDLTISIPIRKSNPLGEYNLDGLQYGRAWFWDGRPAKEYSINGNYTGKINITRFDSMNHIYSGTFEMKVFNYQDSVERNITQGRFDIKI